MTPPDELPLRDIVLPPEVGIWPLAPGWWALIAIAGVAVLLLIGQRLWRHRTRLRRLGLGRLREIVAACPPDTGDHRLAEALSMLCRQLALAYPGGRAAAALTGAPWAAHLDAMVRNSSFFSSGDGARLLEAAFQPDVVLSRTSLVAGLEVWIGGLPPLPLRWHLNDV